MADHHSIARRRTVGVGLTCLLLILGAAAPACAGAAKALRVIPFPGTPDASRSSEIIFSALTRSDLASVNVIGATSGAHAGRLVTLPHSAGVAFAAARPFTPGEVVRVRAGLVSAAAGEASGNGASTDLNWSFRVAISEAPSAARDVSGQTAPAGPTQDFHSRPGLHPPLVSITRDADSRSGKVFLTPNGRRHAGAMLLDSRGGLVWYRPSRQPVYNLERQWYLGRPVLTWWQGYWLRSGQDYVVDRSYRTVAVVHAPEGYHADLHEFQLTPQGTALVDSYSPVQGNLSAVGGSPSGSVLDCVVQEIDVRTGRLLWEWHALGHVPVSASYTGAPGSSSAYDFFHINSIQPLADGNFLVSSRSDWAVYEISRRTGHVIWKLGGRDPSFRMGRGTRFEWQHDAHLNSDGTLTLFDDAGSPEEEPQASALTLRVNTRLMTATLVHRYTHSPSLRVALAGSMETLSNHDVFVGWGGQPFFSEYTAAGRLVFDGHFPYGVWSYRAYRFPWTGHPASRPALAVTRGPSATTLYASWNGATQVAYWQALAGTGPHSLHPVGPAVRWTGFETRIRRDGRHPYWSVEALDAHRRPLDTALAEGMSARG